MSREQNKFSKIIEEICYFKLTPRKKTEQITLFEAQLLYLYNIKIDNYEGLKNAKKRLFSLKDNNTDIMAKAIGEALTIIQSNKTEDINLFKLQVQQKMDCLEQQILQLKQDIQTKSAQQRQSGNTVLPHTRSFFHSGRKIALNPAVWEKRQSSVINKRKLTNNDNTQEQQQSFAIPQLPSNKTKNTNDAKTIIEKHSNKRQKHDNSNISQHKDNNEQQPNQQTPHN